MNDITTPKPSGAGTLTTKRRELLGWCGAMTYMFLMMWGHQTFLVGSSLFINGSWIDSAAMLAFAAFIAVFSFLFGRDPNGLAKIAGYTTPAAIVITVILGLLPSSFASVLYIFACIFMCPAIARSVYGVIHTAKPGTQLTRYMVGWMVASTAFALWIIAALPREIAFLIPALFAVLMWIGTPRKVSIPDEPPAEKAIKFSKSSMLVFGLMALVTLWFNLMAGMLMNNLFAGGDLTSDTVSVINTLITWIPPGIGMTVFAYISDKGHERAGFMVGMGMFLVSVMCLILLNDTQSTFYLPLAMSNLIGGMYVVFFASAFPLYFLLSGAKRPVFITSAGLIFITAFEAVSWKKNLYLPDSLVKLGIPLYVTAAISAVVFIVLVYLLFERYREKTLAAALYDLLHNQTKEETPGEETSDTQSAVNVTAAGLTAGEMDVALLLIEGETKRDIARKLHLPAAEVSQSIDALRDKVIHAGDPDPVIAAAIVKYKLAPRETDVLRCVRQGMTNSEIAPKLFMSEETVRVHVHNLTKKLSAKNRQELVTWSDTPGRD